MLGRDEILSLVTHIGCRIGFLDIAARLFGLLYDKRPVALFMQVSGRCLLFILDPHQRSSIARDFPPLGQHQRDRLAAELDLVVVKRTERRTFFRRDIVLPGFVTLGHAGTVLMSEYLNHALDTQRFAGVDPGDAAFRDR